MAIYAIGDLQGCYTELCRLLEKINFEPSTDRLWFCGDLVNRGPQSLQTLRFVKSLGESAITVLGNHDLHLLAMFHCSKRLNKTDSLYELMTSHDCPELMDWLSQKPLMHYDEGLSAVMVHAGVHPAWDLAQAMDLSAQLQAVIRGPDKKQYFSQMYGDSPNSWSDELIGMDRWRLITNIFTRMRFLNATGKLNFEAKGSHQQHFKQGLKPWFESKSRIGHKLKIIFGHWSTLEVGVYGRHYALDGGCVWGNQLVALRLDIAPPRWHYHLCRGKI